MKKNNGYFMGLITICAACVTLSASCSLSPQTNVGFTPGRASATVIAVMGLFSLVIGWLALRAASHLGTSNGRVSAIAALVLGLIAMVSGVVHLGTSTGGFGTGGGRAGAIVALVLGLIGMNLGGFALFRSRRSRNID
jgi:hypothetical protein